MNVEQVKILDRNIIAHGTNEETVIAMEELSELIKAISKVRRYGLIGDHKRNLIEEIADVNIVVYELMMMFDISYDEVSKVINRKIARIAQRLNKAEGKDDPNAGQRADH
ncbi:MAG: hypothetical protein ACI4J7_11410 [Ruminiclostridium sp.]